MHGDTNLNRRHTGSPKRSPLPPRGARVRCYTRLCAACLRAVVISHGSRRRAASGSSSRHRRTAGESFMRTPRAPCPATESCAALSWTQRRLQCCGASPASMATTTSGEWATRTRSTTARARRRAHERGRNALFPDIDFCRDPSAVCRGEHPELRWIAGFFYWLNDVQTYDARGAA